MEKVQLFLLFLFYSFPIITSSDLPAVVYVPAVFEQAASHTCIKLCSIKAGTKKPPE